MNDVLTLAAGVALGIVLYQVVSVVVFPALIEALRLSTSARTTSPIR